MTRSTPTRRFALSLSVSLAAIAAMGCDPQAAADAADSASTATDTGAPEAVPGAAALAEAESILGEGSWSLTGPECGPMASFARVELITDAGVEVRLLASDEALSCADYNAAERELENLQIVRAIAAQAGDVEAQCETIRDTLIREMWAEESLRPSGSCTLALDPRGGAPPSLELGSPARLGLMAIRLGDCTQMTDSGDLFAALAEALMVSEDALGAEVITFEGRAEPSLKVGATATGVSLQIRPQRSQQGNKPALSVRGLAETCVVDLRD